MTQLVLSLFPGIGVLDKGFEEAGFAVVRGPDILWGGDIREFHPPPGRFDGVIGGPPCQKFSGLANLVKIKTGREFPNLIPEFERCVEEAAPLWFLMENVPNAPLPEVPGYVTTDRLLNNHDLGHEQNRERRFTMGLGRHSSDCDMGVDCWCEPSPPRFHIELPALVPLESVPTVTAAHAGGRPVGGKTKRSGLTGKNVVYPVAEMLRLQGLPGDCLDDAPFTVDGKRKVIAAAVPLPMARAIARAVKEALQ